MMLMCLAVCLSSTINIIEKWVSHMNEYITYVPNRCSLHSTRHMAMSYHTLHDTTHIMQKRHPITLTPQKYLCGKRKMHRSTTMQCWYSTSNGWWTVNTVPFKLLMHSNVYWGVLQKTSKSCVERKGGKYKHSKTRTGNTFQFWYVKFVWWGLLVHWNWTLTKKNYEIRRLQSICEGYLILLN